MNLPRINACDQQKKNGEKCLEYYGEGRVILWCRRCIKRHHPHILERPYTLHLQFLPFLKSGLYDMEVFGSGVVRLQPNEEPPIGQEGC